MTTQTACYADFASNKVFRGALRFNNRYGVTAKRYVRYAALPSVGLSILGIIAAFIIECRYMVHPGLLCAIGLTLYSTANLIVLADRLSEYR